MNIGSVLTEAARKHPEHTAIVYGELRRSYRALNERANRLASALRRSGLGRGDRVAILQRNCPELVETLFASFKAGAVAVPINSRLHPREYQYVIDHSGAKVVVITQEFREGIASIRDELPNVEQVICVDGAAPELAGYDTVLAQGAPEDDDLDMAPDELCWFFYTSGTTGRPKGAMLSHGNLRFMTDRYVTEVYPLKADDVVLHAGPLTHGSGLWALPITEGGATQVINDSASFSPEHVFRLIERHKVTKIVFIAPTMISMLLRSPAIDDYDMSSLRFIGYGGSNMLVEDLKRAIRKWGSILCQIYGQGESPMTISMLRPSDHVLSDDPVLEQRLASAGTVREGIELAVLDENDQLAARGAIGEICLRGTVIMKGYWQDEKATAEALKGSWYHTGDLGKLDDDGYVYLLDRKKELIISGGANIYPREVEEVLLLHPAAIEVAVVGIPDPLWGESVLALVRTRGGAPVPEAELVELIRQRLAGYKKPRYFRFVADLPKNAYGKILKRELRQKYTAELAAPEPGAPAPTRN
jgi:acyl-CoA synthetase (AMP-forming)/AMP-acid ligase II